MLPTCSSCHALYEAGKDYHSGVCPTCAKKQSAELLRSAKQSQTQDPPIRTAQIGLSPLLRECAICHKLYEGSQYDLTKVCPDCGLGFVKLPSDSSSLLRTAVAGLQQDLSGFVKLPSGSSSLTLEKLSGIGSTESCALCGQLAALGAGPALARLSGWSRATTNDGKDRVVDQIMETLSLRGSFSVGGVREFWRNFLDELCSKCQTKLNSLTGRKQEAVKLLEEAVRLDTSNKTAKQNLEAVRKML